VLNEGLRASCVTPVSGVVEWHPAPNFIELQKLILRGKATNIPGEKNTHIRFVLGARPNDIAQAHAENTSSR